jgi:hypothetical protein
MGLDITVYRVVEATDEKVKSDDSYFYLEDFPELNQFKDLSRETSVEIYDYESAIKEKGYNLEDLEEDGYEIGDVVKFFFKVIKTGEVVTFTDIKTVPKKRNLLCVEEIGYQRKGANKKFYEDDMWESPCILDKKTLEEHGVKYFSEETPDSKGGWGSGVEFELEDEERKSRFKENIIDKFEEGKSFVIYH